MKDETLDAALRVLANSRRRQILAYLKNQDDVAEADRLVEYLVRGEIKPGVDEDALRKEIAISLHHHHLPKLRDYGVIEEDFSRSHAATEHPAYCYAGSAEFSALLDTVIEFGQI